MRISQKFCGEQRDLSVHLRIGGNGVLFGDFFQSGNIRKLFVTHFQRFFKNLFSGGIRQNAGVIDSFGNSISGQTEGIGNILYGNTVRHKVLLYIFALFVTIVIKKRKSVKYKM